MDIEFEFSFEEDGFMIYVKKINLWLNLQLKRVVATK